MAPTLVHIVPIAIAVALEPLCVIAALVMLTTERPLANSAAYLAALLAAMLGYGAAVVLLFRHHALSAGTHTDDVVQVLWLLIGLGFLTAFVVVLLRRPSHDERPRESRWVRLVQKMGPLGAAGVGLFLVNWEMETPALTEIVQARVQVAAALAAVLVFTAIAVSTSAAPLVVYLAAPSRAGAMLGGGSTWLRRRQRLIVLGLFLLVGTVYAYKGAAALLRQ